MAAGAWSGVWVIFTVPMSISIAASSFGPKSYLHAARRLPTPLKALAQENRDAVHENEEGEQDQNARRCARNEAALGTVGPDVDLGGQRRRGVEHAGGRARDKGVHADEQDRKSTRLNSSHGYISYAVF